MHDMLHAVISSLLLFTVCSSQIVFLSYSFFLFCGVLVIAHFSSHTLYSLVHCTFSFFVRSPAHFSLCFSLYLSPCPRLFPIIKTKPYLFFFFQVQRSVQGQDPAVGPQAQQHHRHHWELDASTEPLDLPGGGVCRWWHRPTTAKGWLYLTDENDVIATKEGVVPKFWIHWKKEFSRWQY